MHTTVFFSWQSTRPGRNLIDRALQEAIDRISDASINLEEPERGERIQLDRDTRNVPGSPPIFDTILKKIANAAIFVSDLTFVGTSVEDDLLPNPNVLIEHGFALRVLGDGQIIAVMNIAHGQPEELPFDLKTKRFPITYDLPDDADDATRTKVRNKLSKDFEEAIRAILQGPEFLASLPKPPEPPARIYREPLEGRARFRKKGDPLGYAADGTTAILGGQERPIHLQEGSASWLRVVPVTALPSPLNASDIKSRLGGLMMLSLIDAGSSPYSIRYGDGCGYYRDDGERLAPNVAFVFRDDAEIWVIDTWYLRARPALIILEAHRWAKTLQQVAEFLTTDLNIPGPYHWIAGYEGVAGRKLNISDQMGRTWGPCADNIIEKDGKFSFGQNAEEVLQKFFREIYEQCGAPVSQPRV